MFYGAFENINVETFSKLVIIAMWNSTNYVNTLTLLHSESMYALLKFVNFSAETKIGPKY